MKKTFFRRYRSWHCASPASMPARQAGSPAERKAFKEYTSPQELVSIAPDHPARQGAAAISEVSKKFTGKIMIDTEHRTMPINVDIQGMQWQDALEAICRKNDLWYTEYENYIQITSTGAAAMREGAAGAIRDRPACRAASASYKEPASFRSREVKISAYFFEVNLDQARRSRDRTGLHEEHEQRRLMSLEFRRARTKSPTASSRPRLRRKSASQTSISWPRSSRTTSWAKSFPARS